LQLDVQADLQRNLTGFVWGGTVLAFRQELQEKQKAKSKVFYECKKQLIQLHLNAAKCVEEQISPLQETLLPISYKA
jgi:hypothetical protein